MVSSLESIWDLTASIFFTLSIQACLSKYKMRESTQVGPCKLFHFFWVVIQLPKQWIPHCCTLQCVTFVLIHTCKCESYKSSLKYYFVVPSSNWKYVSVPYVDRIIDVLENTLIRIRTKICVMLVICVLKMPICIQMGKIKCHTTIWNPEL